MAKEIVELEVKSNIGEVSKETKDLTNNFGAFGITIGSIKQKFKDVGKIMVNGLKMIKLQAQLAGVGLKQMFSGKMVSGAKNLFTAIKVGVASTGIGLLIIAFAGLIQYFKDSEAGASKFKQITAMLGVVVGNVTDIISNMGKAFFKLLTGDLKGFKEGIAEATQGVKDFGETTRREMKMANQLEKDRLALQKFEREAIVEKARTEKDMMELRLKARDFEKFSAEERLQFMRTANKLAAEQLEKDMHVAKEKLRFQIEENSYSKSTQQNLDDEANLQAAVFNLEKANFSERKRMKSEEQAIVKELAAAAKSAATAAATEAKKIKADEQKARDEEFAAMQKANEEWNVEQAKKFAKTAEEDAMLLELQRENSIAALETLKERALKELEIQEEKELASAELMENSEAMKAAIAEKFTGKRAEVEKKFNKDKKKWSEMSSEAQLDIMSSTAGNMIKILGEETAAGKAMAVTQATIDTYKGATAAYSSMAGIPYVGPVLGAIAAGAAVASGLANVKAILSADASGAVDDKTVKATAKAPAPEMLSGKFELGGGVEPEPLKAFVVTDEMTNSQDQLANIRRRATV